MLHEYMENEVTKDMIKEEENIIAGAPHRKRKKFQNVAPHWKLCRRREDLQTEERMYRLW